MSEPVLTQGDRLGATWKRIEKHLQVRLAKLRELNDKNLPDGATQRLRGHIACLKEIISLGTEQPTIASEDALFKD